MRVENWFSVPIWFVDTNINLEPVKDKCFAMMNEGFENVVLSNRGGWQSKSIHLSDFQEFNELENCVNTHLADMSQQIHPDFRCRIDNSWININFKHNYNARHHHYQSALSGCIYIDVQEDSGNIRFFRGGLQSHYPFNGFNSNLFHEHVEYQALTGRLLVFPAWLEHEVTSNLSDIPRVSIAFNIQQI